MEGALIGCLAGGAGGLGALAGPLLFQACFRRLGQGQALHAQLFVLDQGLFGGDPIAVRVADTTIALRRREAMAILVTAVSS